MAITKHNFVAGGTIFAEDFNELENEVDTALNNKLNKTGDTMTATLQIKTNDIERGVIPSVYQNIPLFRLLDKNNKIVGALGCETGENGSLQFNLHCYKINENTSFTNQILSVGCDKDGNFYTRTITPSATDNSAKIVTTKFVNGGNIVASGDNYVRYANGLQICWGSKAYTLSATTQWGCMYEGAINDYMTFPVAFSSTPNISFNSIETTVFFESSNISTTGCKPTYVCRPLSTSTMTCTLAYIAIGKWK